MSQFLEAMMVICFGISWPVSIVKSIRAKTAKGKSWIFIVFILVGYAFGILSKVMSGKITYVFFFYVLNFIVVFIDGCLYLRNYRLDMQRERGTGAADPRKDG